MLINYILLKSILILMEIHIFLNGIRKIGKKLAEYLTQKTKNMSLILTM